MSDIVFPGFVNDVGLNGEVLPDELRGIGIV